MNETYESDKKNSLRFVEQQICEGSCENHQGEVKLVHVGGWGYWAYCDTAIAEDISRGLSVTIVEGENSEQ